MGFAVAADRKTSLSAMWGALVAALAAPEKSSWASSYDPSGNLTAAGNRTHTWNYNNFLSAVSGTGTSTYKYDHAGQRVLQIGGGATSTYPNKFFSVATSTNNKGTSTEYIYAGNELLATIEGTSTASAITRYIHPDHLGSTNVVSDANMNATQTLDYYPYGGTRIDTGTDVSQREFIGQFLDEQNGLSYLNARYYEGSRGQFLSQDQTHLAIGDPGRLQSTVGVSQQFVLRDPQLMNSYSYGKNNPITNKDPQGNIPAAAIPFILFGAGAALDAGVTYYTDVMGNRAQGNANPYTDNLSSGAEYGVGAASGGITMSSLGIGRVSGGLIAGGTSIAQDRIAGREPDFGKALITTGGTIAAGTAFKGLVGASPFEKAATRGLSQSAITQGLRYETSQGLLQSGMNSIAVSNYQSRNYNTQQNFNQSSGGVGSLSSVLSSLSRALSSLSKALSSLKK